MKYLALALVVIAAQASAVAAAPLEVDTRSGGTVTHYNHAEARDSPVLTPRNDTVTVGNTTLTSNGTDVSATQDLGFTTVLSAVSGLFSLFNIGKNVSGNNKKTA